MPQAKTASAPTLAMIERLVSFDTTSRNSNLELIHDVASYLADHDVRSNLTYDDDGRKANLYATLGPQDKPGIALSGHTDVVPVDGQDWSSDPFALHQAEDRVYGRGTCDMKGFIAVVLALVPRFLERGLETPIHLCFSYDEEVGCRGIGKLLAYLADQPVKPNACIVGEPTEMKVVRGHKGGLGMNCQVRGYECHSSLAPQGVNAVEAAAKVIAKLSEIATDKAQNGPFDYAFDIPHTTVHTGVIQGGTALNIVPRDCGFEFEVRNLPSEDPFDVLKQVQDFVHRDLEPDMKAIDSQTGFTWHERSNYPGMDTPEDAEIIALAKTLTGANATSKVAFGTEGGFFQQAGIPAVICGPGSIAQAHKPDEFVSLEQLALCEAFLERLMDRVCRQ